MAMTYQHEAVKEEIRDSVASGLDVHEKIKAITLKALTERQLDIENIKTVAEAVSNGIYEGMSTQSEQTKEAFSHAASALDDALAIAAEASKLAIEEAASKVDEYSHRDLNEATEGLQGMENTFLDALDKAAKDGNHMVSDIVGDFVNHARQSGTAVGTEVLAALDALKGLPHLSKETVVSSTVATTINLAQIGSGILSGIAESLQSSQSKK